jgi:small-conductance mechanosensitive channel
MIRLAANTLGTVLVLAIAGVGAIQLHASAQPKADSTPKLVPVAEQVVSGRSGNVPSIEGVAGELAEMMSDITGRADLQDYLRRGLTFVLVTAAILLVSLGLRRAINKYIEDLSARYYLNKVVVYVAAALILLFLLVSLLANLTAVSAVIGLAGAGVAIALRDVITSFVGWFFIISSKGIHIGDRVEIGTIRGDVVDIGALRTTLMEIGNWVDADQSTGRLVSIPNNFVFRDPLYNFTTGHKYIWNEISFLITFESDADKAREMLLDIANEQCGPIVDRAQGEVKAMASHYMYKIGKLTPIVYVVVADSGVKLTLRYLTEARQRRSTQDTLSRAILKAITEAETVDFAYPTTRFYHLPDQPEEPAPEQPTNG